MVADCTSNSEGVPSHQCQSIFSRAQIVIKSLFCRLDLTDSFSVASFASSRASRVARQMRRLLLVPIALLLSLPVLALGNSDYQTALPATATADAPAAIHSFLPQDGLLQHIKPAPADLTLAQSPPPAPTSSNIGRFVPTQRGAISGVVRRITLSFLTGLPAPDQPVYNLINPPEGTTRDPVTPYIFNIPSLSQGVYTLTVEYKNGNSAGFQQVMMYRVFNPPMLDNWGLTADGEPTFAFAGDSICHPQGKSDLFPNSRDHRNLKNVAHRVYQFINVRFSYNGGPNQGTAPRANRAANVENDASGTNCRNDNLQLRDLNIGSGGARSRLESQFNTANKRVDMTIKSPLANGVHNYRVWFQVGGSGYGGTDGTGSFRDHYYYTSPTPFDITYVTSNSTVTISEVIRTNAPIGHRLATLTIGSNLVGATWQVQGSPDFAVNTRRVGSELFVEMGEAAPIDFETSPDFLLLTLSTRGKENALKVYQALITLSIKLKDVEEVPAFLEPLFSQGIVKGSSGFQISDATDPSGNGVTFSAVENGESSLPTGISFDAGIRTFTADSSAVLGTYSIRVRVEDNADSNDFSEEVFVLSVINQAGIFVLADDLVPLTKEEPSDKFMVQLAVAPSSNNVTLTLESLVPTDVEISPLTLEFSPTNWYRAQEVTAKFINPTNKIDQVVSLSLGVYSAGSSDSTYQSAMPVSLDIQVNNANQDPSFPESARIRSLPEGAGKDETEVDILIGAPVVAEDSDNDPGDLTYSLMGTSSTFKVVAASGQLQVAAATNFNHEKGVDYKVTLQVHDGESAPVRRGMAMVTVAITITDINETPDNYTSYNLVTLGATRGAITLEWNNTEYEAQFDADDRSSLVISYGSAKGVVGTMTLAQGTTETVLRNLAPGTLHSITINWYSADNLGSVLPATLTASTAANAVPAFVGNLRYTRPENIGAQETEAGEALVTLVAQDADSDDIVTYSIVAGADSAVFAIDSYNGILSPVRNENFNHEVKAAYTVTVQAVDNFGSFVRMPVSLGITPVNEAPEFPEQVAVQRAAVGTQSTFDLIGATDPDLPTASDFGYQATLGDGTALPAWLVLDGSTGQFTVGSSAVAGDYQIKVKAVETGQSPNLESVERSFRLVVAASGSTNNLPTLADATIVIPENTVDSPTTASGTQLTTVLALDADFADVISYSLAGADAAFFAIDSASGVLTVKDDTAFDREDKNRYEFAVVVDDGNGGVISAQYVVEISNQPEAPVINPIAEQLAIRGIVKAFQLNPAVDPEGDSLVYTASSPGSWLTFDAAKIQFTVSSSAPLGAHIVTLTATEAGNSPNLEAERSFMIRVQSSDDLNRPPVFASSFSFSLAENTGSATTPVGTTVGVATATDTDALTYAISGADAAPFGIGATTGSITVATATGFDRETKASYMFRVTADDGNGGTSSADVVVAITNVNEPPVFAQLPLQQLTRGATLTVTVPAAVDPEGDPLTYTATSPGSWLTFDPSVPEFEVAPGASTGEHVVTLTATESGNTPNLTAQMTFTLRIQADPGENPAPVFSGATKFELQESGTQDTPPGTLVGVVTARDEEGKVAYSIEVSADAVPFGIDAIGQIQVTVATRFDADVKAAYTIQVMASDGNSAARAQVTVQIIPLAEVSAAEKDNLSINAIDRAIAIAAMDIVATRLDSVIASSSGGSIPRPDATAAGERLAAEDLPSMRMGSIDDQWNNWRVDEHEGAEDRFVNTDWEDFLYSRGFDFALTPPDRQQLGPQPRLWGLGSKLSLDGRPSIGGVVVPYQGDANVLMLGVESFLGEAKIGLAAGQSKVEFTVGEEKAQVERTLHSVHPYVNWQPFASTDAWLAAGIGTGDYSRKEGGQEEQVRDAEYMSVSGGLRRNWQFGEFQLGLGSKAMGGKSVLKRTAALQKSKSQDWRLELDFRVGLPLRIADSAFGIDSFLGGNLRRDGGDGIKTNEMDVEAGTRLDWDGGLSAGISGRWQITTKRETNERRITGTFSYDAGADGQGLMVAFEPGLDVARSQDGVLRRDQQMHTSIGYGLPLQLFADSGTILLNAKFNHAGVAAAQAYGFSFAGRRLQIDLSAADSAYRFKLRLQ